MRPHSIKSFKSMFFVVAGLTLAACGGGGGAPSPGTPAQPAAATTAFGTITKSAGAVAVNGVAFATHSGTVVRIDDNPKGVDDLRDGMVVKLRGSDDGTNRRAERIEVENEVRGTVTAIGPADADPQHFSIGALRVIVDRATVFDNLSPRAFAGIAVGTYVEVHGLRDAAGNLRATRVEGQVRNAANPIDELKGTVGALDKNANTFTLGTVTVNYGTATFSPAGASEASLANGIGVEVHGAFNAAGTVFTATRVDIEDLEDDNLKPRAGDRFEIEGFVAALDTAARTFTVNGQLVSYGPTTQFRNGTVADLAENQRVEVDGTLSGTTLVAREVSFKQARVLLMTQPSTVDVANRRLTMFGRTVKIDDQTEQRTPLAAIVPNSTRVEVRAFLDSAGDIVAERIEASNSGGSDDIVQAVVSAKDPVARTVTLLGVTALLDAAEFEDANDAPISEAQFFAAITVGRTVVKVKGTSFNATSLRAREAEIEN
jgi:hypothetical protein